jgi:hypothetical protein
MLTRKAIAAFTRRIVMIPSKVIISQSHTIKTNPNGRPYVNNPKKAKNMM